MFLGVCEWRRNDATEDSPPSEQPQLQPGRLGHLVRSPGWIEDDLDVELADPREAADLSLHVLLEDLTHPAAGGGEGHADLDAPVAVGEGERFDAVDQPEIDDVDRDLRIVDGPEDIPDHFFTELFGLITPSARGRLAAQRVRVFAGNADHVAPGGDD